MSTEKVHFQMEMFGIADRSVNGRIEGQKVQNSSLDSPYSSNCRSSAGKMLDCVAITGFVRYVEAPSSSV